MREKLNREQRWQEPVRPRWRLMRQADGFTQSQRLRGFGDVNTTVAAKLHEPTSSTPDSQGHKWKYEI